jgi:zinc transport system ATP-binding protein
MRAAVQINNLNVSYNNLKVLEDINLTVAENDFIGIIGPNGGGKTTLLKALTGIIEPDNGSINVFGKSISEENGLVGYVPQFSSFENTFPISVYNVVRMGMIHKRQYETSKIDEILKSVELFDIKNKLIGELSGGQKQRVLIARALVSKPKVLLLDEPTSSIDPKTGKSVYGLLNKLNETTTIILVSHDIGAISSYVKKIACLNKTLVFHDSKEITNEMLEETYQCPVDLIAHGLPHRILNEHKH